MRLDSIKQEDKEKCLKEAQLGNSEKVIFSLFSASYEKKTILLKMFQRLKALL